MQDHMRRAGDVCFSQVFRDGSGRILWRSFPSDIFPVTVDARSGKNINYFVLLLSIYVQNAWKFG